MFSGFQPTVQLAHCWLNNYLLPGAKAVDATVGNGHDTLYLARKVGTNGRVYGFEIQEKALQNALELIKNEGFEGVVQLFHTGHENIAGFIKDEVDVIIFNLGYLPGGEHSIVTRPDTTIKAVKDGLVLVKKGGVICLVIYTGHPGGEEEQFQLEYFLSGLDKQRYCVTKLNFLNREKAPYILMIEKSHASGRG
jgi:predicted methyltransferase